MIFGRDIMSVELRMVMRIIAESSVYASGVVLLESLSFEGSPLNCSG